MTEFDLGRIVGRVELDTIQFQRSYTETITRLRALRTEAQKSAVGVDDLDASFGTVSKTASTTATAISRSDRAMVGAASSASDAAVAFIAASDASAGLRAAQLGVISAQAKLNALLAAGKAGTAQYASAQAGLIRAEDRVIAVQNREAAAVEATMRARQAQAAAADRAAAQIAAAAAREARAVERSAQRQAEADARKAVAAQRSVDRVAAVNQKTAASAARATGMVVKGATLAAAVIGYESLKAAASFQQSTNVYVTAAGESVKNLGVIRKGIENIAVATGTSIENLTGAEYLVEKAGYRGAAGLKVLDAASKGAREENANLSDVVQAMTSVMASYHLTASQSVQVMNALKTGAGQAKVTMEEYAGSLSTVIPIASANHIALSQVLGALSTLTQHGTTAKEATQELAATIRALAAPNRVAQTAMQQLGLDVNDVTKNIGKRGLTGTIDLLVDAITTHMGPAGLVLQKAFNQSKTASQDAQIMIEKMPPAVAKLAAAYRDGKITLGDWRAALKELPADQAALAQQYTVVANKANGFNALLRAGDPASQTFTSALKRVSGGAIGLNTVLQLSGENMAGFKRRTDEVNKSLHDSSRDVEGWASTQKLFSVQADRAKQSLHVLGIEIGTNLLPTATKAMDWIATDGVADLRAFGSELADHRNQLVSVGGAVLGMWASWKAYKILSTVVGAVQAAGLAIKGSVTAFAALFTQSAATVEASSLAIQAAEAQSVAAVAAAEAEKASAAAESAATIAEAVAGTSSILAEGAAAAAAAAAEEAVAFQGAADAALAAAAEISAAATAAAGVAETEAAASSVAWGAMLGPVGLIAGGIAGAVLAFHAFGKSAHEQIKPTQELTQAIIDDGNAFGKLTSAMVNHTLEQKGLYDAGLKLGVSQRTLLQATLGNANAQAKVSAAILGTATTAKLSAAQHGKLTKAQNDAASAAKTLNDGLAFESKTLEVNKRAALNETAALGKSADAHKGNASAADKNAASVRAATGTTNGYLGALAKLHDKRITITARDNASSAISKVRAAIQALQSKQITITALSSLVRFLRASKVTAFLRGTAKARVAQTTSGAVTIDASAGDIQHVVMSGNVTGTTITNPTTGQQLTLTFVQDGTGSRTYAWPTITWGQDGNAPTAQAAANARDSVTIQYDGSNWNEINRSRPSASTAAAGTLGIVRTCPIGATTAVTFPAANAVLYYRVEDAQTISKVRVEVGTASGNIGVSVLRSAGAGQTAPGVCIATSGLVTAVAGVQDLSLGGSVSVAVGDWIAISADNTTVTMYALTATNLVSTRYAGRAYYKLASSLPTVSSTPSGLSAGINKIFDAVGVT